VSADGRVLRYANVGFVVPNYFDLALHIFAWSLPIGNELQRLFMIPQDRP
jgi:hypothetical protein